VSDLVSRLLEAIEAKEEKARAVLDRELWDELDEALGRDWPNWLPEDRGTVRAYMVDNDPSSVLRRCKADRETIVQCQRAIRDDEASARAGDLHRMQHTLTAMLAWFVLDKMAESYGITEEET